MKYEVQQISALEKTTSQILDGEIQKTIFITLMIGVDDFDLVEMTFTICKGEEPVVEFDEKYVDLEATLKAEAGFTYLHTTSPSDYAKKIRHDSKLMKFYEDEILPFMNE
jgi:hypothetical protein